VLAKDAVDRDFVSEATEGFEALRALVEATSWDALERASGVDRQTMEKVGDLYLASRRTIFAWTMGITHHLHGVENVQWMANLALLRGMVGKEGAGLMPIRGHSNVQGMGTVGVTPALKPEMEARWRDAGLLLPDVPGLDTMGCLDAVREGRMRVGIALGGNLL